MISLNNISISFSGKDLFNDISFIINPKDRIGLVGKNGVGKSTLLKVIFGIQPTTKGSIAISEGATMGYLPQEIKVDSEKSIFDETMTVFDEVIQLNKRIDNINIELAERTDYESEAYQKLIHDLTEMHDRLNVLDSNKMESTVEKVLKGLGFKEEEFQKPISEFSGGWQMRVELGKLLIQKPSLLLLDEPTNHLDIEAILWLEEYFKNYPGSIIMISHDRMFLDNITNRTIEIVFGKIYDYKVAYSKYFELRQDRYDQQVATMRNQQKYIEQQEKFIERFKAKATKAKAVQSKMKMLDKIDRVEIDELDSSSIKFHFPPAPRSGDVVVRADELSKSYEDHLVFHEAKFTITRGERIAFVGQNGQGKSTMVKLITDKLKHEGELTIGHNVEIGYYAQVQENTLDQNKTVLEVIEDAATEEWSNVSKIRGLLGAFLFGADDIDKKVKVLSGGEKSRLALAKLLLRPVNLLILDEPTNHLDISAKEMLKEALNNYNGTLILVSHDRDFLNGLTNKTYEFINKKVKEHIGPIQDFLRNHAVESFREFEAGKKVEKKKVETKKEEKVSDNKISYAQRKEREKELRKIRNAIKKREEKISQLESDIETLEVKMHADDFYANEEESKATFFKHSELTQQLEQNMVQWEELQLQLEEEENKTT